MFRSRWIAIGSCVLSLTAFACGDDSGDGNSAGTGAAGTGAAGTGAAGTGVAGMAAAGTGAAGMGAAGMGAAPNMPDQMCIMTAGASDPCTACACTPNANGGCLNEAMGCEGTADDMHNMLCGAIVDCARMNNCTGMACATPCMAEIGAAIGYMSAAPLTAASNLGMCTSTSCAAAGCPTAM